MHIIQRLLVIASVLLSFTCLCACTQIKDFFASSTSSASLSSSSASSGSISASSASSDSSERSSESFFNSSSRLFIKDDQYINDIIDLTYAYASFSPIEDDYQSFQNGISAIASRNGIISWENNPKTYFAIGKGLNKAKLTGAHYQNFKQRVTGSDYAKMKDIQKGYEAK